MVFNETSLQVPLERKDRPYPQSSMFKMVSVNTILIGIR